MKVWQVVIYGVALALLVGCNTLGLGSKQVDYRSGAVQTPSLEVPPDLTTPGKDERYRVPQGNGESVATFSDYSKGGASATQSRSAGAVLPELKSVSLERNGAQRWLTVKDKPENVWPVVKAFFQENGWTIKSEDQTAGLMETDWIENIPNVSRSWFGKFLNKIQSSDQRNLYSARLERGKDGVSTEVHITHRGMEEVMSADGMSAKWQARPNDPEMEAAMLQRLMARLGGSETQALASAATDRTDSASGPAGAAILQEVSDGNRIILVNDAFDRSWRRVGLAIEQAGLVVEDKDRVKGVYFIRPVKAASGWMDKLQFWKESNNTSTRYRVNVKDGIKGCEVSVTDQDGASNDATRQMVEVLYKNIDQGETAKTSAAGAVPARAATINETGLAGTASIQEIFDGSSVIVVNDVFDKSWRRVGLAIERAGLVVEANDRAKGVYFLRPDKAESGWMDKLQFWKGSNNASTRYRVNVKDGGKACEVSVSDQDGMNNDATMQMIKAIYKNISQ